jgi:hypothetical protein
MTYLKAQYPGMTVDEVWMVTDDKSATTYKTKISIKHDLVFDPNGEVVKPKGSK